jgi:hypothetical protein
MKTMHEDEDPRSKAALEAECKSPGQILQESYRVHPSDPKWDDLVEASRESWEQAAWSVANTDAGLATPNRQPPQSSSGATMVVSAAKCKTPGQALYERRLLRNGLTPFWDKLDQKRQQEWEDTAAEESLITASASPTPGQQQDDIAEYGWRHDGHTCGEIGAAKIKATAPRGVPPRTYDHAPITAALDSTHAQTLPNRANIMLGDHDDANT